jgi:hypothetical protein
VKFSLLNSEQFSEEGLKRAKSMIVGMLEKGIEPNSMHLLFCKDGFICPNSKANGQVLQIRKTATGKGKFWVSKTQQINNHFISALLISLFLIGLVSQYR